MVADGDIGGIPVSAEVLRSGKVVPMPLCSEYRAHIETKINGLEKNVTTRFDGLEDKVDDVEKNIQITIKTSIAVGGFVLALLQILLYLLSG